MLKNWLTLIIKKKPTTLTIKQNNENTRQYFGTKDQENISIFCVDLLEKNNYECESCSENLRIWIWTKIWTTGIAYVNPLLESTTFKRCDYNISTNPGLESRHFGQLSVRFSQALM